MSNRVGPNPKALPVAPSGTTAASQHADPLVRLGAQQGKLGEALAQAVTSGTPLSSSELGRMLNLLPSMSTADRLALHSTLSEAHRAMGAPVPPLASPGQPTAAELLELAASPAIPRDLETLSHAQAQNAAALADVKAKLATETNPAAKKALQRDEARLNARGTRLEGYAAALAKPVLAFVDGWKVAAERVAHQLKNLAPSPLRDELTAAQQQLLARSALENDPKRQLGTVPLLGERLVDLTKGGRLEASEVATFLGTDHSRGLVDLSPPQRKAVLETFGDAMGEDVLPAKLLKIISRPVNAEHIINVLSSPERFPKTPAEITGSLNGAKLQLAEAQGQLEGLLKGRVPDTLPPAEQKKLAEAQTKVAYATARVDELSARARQLERGLPSLPVQPWPTSVEGAATQIGRLQTRIGETRERLIVEGPTNAPLRQQLQGELEVLDAQKRTLETLHRELSQIPTLTAWQKTGVTVAVNALPLKVPGLFALWGSVGVVRDPADRLTQKNELRPYVSAGVTTPIAGLGAMYSSTVKGFQGELNTLPGVSIGRNPLLGDFVGVCIPGVIAGTMSSNGTVGVTAYFGPVGGRLFLRNEAFAAVTQPLLDAITAGADAVVKLVGPLRMPIEDALRPVSDAVKDAASAVKRKVSGA